MALKYVANFYGTHGTYYSVKLYDTLYVGTSSAITLADPGFTLEYQGQGRDIFDPIKGSQCKVHLMITDDTAGANLLTWLQSTVLTKEEDRFNVEIFRDGEEFWYGVVLPDLSGMQDASRPFEFVLTATDGLARLKDFEYTAASGVSNLMVFTDAINYALESTPVYRNSGYGSVFSTVVNWYEDQMEPKAPDIDPLKLTYVHSLTFGKNNDKGEFEALSCYEVLEAICKHWGMRLIMSKGIYKFIQVGAYEGGYDQYERFYNSSGSFITSGAFKPNVNLNVSAGSLPRVQSGGQWAYYPPLKSVRLDMPFQNKNFLNGGDNLPYTDTINTPIIGGLNSFLFSSTLYYYITSVSPGGTTQPWYITFKIKIQLDSAYWASKTGTGSVISWATSTDYIYHVVQTWDPYGRVNLGFITDIIPSGNYSTLDFSIDIDSITYKGFGQTFGKSRITDSTSLTFTSSSSTQSIITYIAKNTNVVINSYDIDEPPALFGDWSNDTRYGTLFIFDSSNVVLSTAKWRIDGRGSSYPINILRVRDILGAQAYATPKYQGTIVGAGTIQAESSITYSSKVYILNGATYYGIPETFDGEWTEVDYQRTQVNSNDPVSSGGEGQQDLQRSIGFVDGRVFYQAQLDYELINSQSTDVYPDAISQTIIATASLAVYLPPAAEWMRYSDRSIEITIMNQDGGGSTVNVYPDGSETINGSADISLSRYHSVTLISDGTELYIKSAFKHT